MMKSQAAGLEVENLCSRKLLELVATRAVAATDLERAVDELQARRHYLQELARAREMTYELPAASHTQH